MRVVSAHFHFIGENMRESDEASISSADVQELLGVSLPTLWRWRNSPEMAFPEPFSIRGRLYWRRQDIADWQSRAMAAGARTITPPAARKVPA
jgi:predicted DNA-binding transcriptional regulator AlpA